MKKIVDVQLRKYGNVFTFDPGDFSLSKGDLVLVETDLGAALGTVCGEPMNCLESFPDRPLKKVLRIATPEDLDRFERHSELEREVYDFCYERIQKRELPMCLVSVDRLFDGSKIMVYFTADGRVDFRELVKDLVRRFRTRIEMRQIGVRHQAKMVGGLGNCGRTLCCTSFLQNFDPVSIKMAKEQNLSLNPSKISGMCGRLMCCLAYEYEYYERVKKNVPRVGKRVKVEQGEGKVVRQNALKRTLTVVLESGEEVEFPFSRFCNGPDQKGRKNHQKGSNQGEH
ncbi:MAG: stage 0 sporulation family protein [Deltaproteobacteria bacterium]|nr:stage 0 sporulation family protein [Deltaproteobacteria bacterium]MBW2015763.1 stage 0 sporulation family protein [Deltaproteobacteria bacterium]